MTKFSTDILKPQDLFIVGPTASGKSSLALQLAEKLLLPIVNCDSLQFFKTLKIGTAYPSDQDLSRAEHLLFGIAEAGTFFSAGQFVREFENLRASEPRKQQSFLITGGSGFYIRALETGMENVLSLSEEMKHKISFLTSLTNDEKLELLRSVDPEALKSIHINDHYRIHRALEIYFSQGLKTSDLKNNFGAANKKLTYAKDSKTISDPTQAQVSTPVANLKLGLYLEKSELLLRVTKRTHEMLKQGLIAEVEWHIEQGLQAWKPMQSVGYKETRMYLSGQISKQDLETQIIASTMYLAKRQMTWFRNDLNVAWFHAENELVKALLWATDHLGKEKVPGSALRS